MREKIEQLKAKLTECGILEAQESNTAYEQAEREDKVFKKEDDKSYKEDRIDLEEILNSTNKKKKDYIRGVIKTIDGMIDGEEDVENLMAVVKQGKGNARRI